MNDTKIKELALASGLKLVSAINEGDSCFLEQEYGISKKMYGEILSYIEKAAISNTHTLVAVPGLNPDEFFLKTEAGETGNSNQWNVSIYKFDDSDGAPFYEVEFPVYIGECPQINTIIFDISLYGERVKIEYSLMEVM